MSRDKVDGLVVLGAVAMTALVAYVSYQSAEARITSDCLKLEKFTVDERVYSCYSTEESGGE